MSLLRSLLWLQRFWHDWLIVFAKNLLSKLLLIEFHKLLFQLRSLFLVGHSHSISWHIGIFHQLNKFLFLLMRHLSLRFQKLLLQLELSEQINWHFICQLCLIQSFDYILSLIFVNVIELFLIFFLRYHITICIGGIFQWKLFICYDLIHFCAFVAFQTLFEDVDARWALNFTQVFFEIFFFGGRVLPRGCQLLLWMNSHFWIFKCSLIMVLLRKARLEISQTFKVF